ncbi:MAG: NADPH-dependent 2,4-dienoyl-CoA reductase, partial [Legionellaceae bacterium]
RQVYLLQRKKEKPGKNLGKTTGWIHRLSLKHHQVKMMAGVTYVRIDDEGLHLLVEGSPCVLSVDSIVLCTGQISLDDLYMPLSEASRSVHRIGGAYKARELDARHAIDQACRLAAML